MLNKLEDIFKDIKLTEYAEMAEFCSFKAGGKARYLVEPKTVSELREVLRLISREKLPHLILGNGTNTLFRDGVYEGVVIRPHGESFNEISVDEAYRDGISNIQEGDEILVRAGSAVLLSELSKFSFNELEAEGMEGLSGIPGSVGGAAFMNAGAYEYETKNIIKSVHAVSPDGEIERDFSNEEMEFGYRHSKLMENGYIVTSVEFALKKGKREDILKRFNEFTEKRRTKQPLDYPSAGSTFKRPTGYFAGKLIQDAGLKGLSVGGAQVSTLHSGFIINKGGATATDIIKLISLIQNTVYDQFGVELNTEVRII